MGKDPKVGGSGVETNMSLNANTHQDLPYVVLIRLWGIDLPYVVLICLYAIDLPYVGNTSILHSINPEIDRTYHRLVRQNRTLDTNFVSVSELPVAENTASEHSVSVHSEYSDSVHSVAFPNFDHFVHSENMAQPPTPPGPRERILRELAVPDFTYDNLCIQYEDVIFGTKDILDITSG
ncbi:hypothetical protein Lal_00039321 [Lupinus albus]|nr:hypothetical protein Lal_00039321 [Lupinus albus]